MIAIGVERVRDTCSRTRSRPTHEFAYSPIGVSGSDPRERRAHLAAGTQHDHVAGSSTQRIDDVRRGAREEFLELVVVTRRCWLHGNPMPSIRVACVPDHGAGYPLAATK